MIHNLIKDVNWNPDKWLFETDLIHYFNDSTEYTIKEDSFVEFYPLFTVDKFLQPGSYNAEIIIA